jgi:hypothetical protein
MCRQRDLLPHVARARRFVTPDTILAGTASLSAQMDVHRWAGQAFRPAGPHQFADRVLDTCLYHGCLLREAPAAVTVAGDKGFDVRSFVAEVRALGVTPHVAQQVTGSAIDGRTTRPAGYTVSQQKRKLIEQVFGWMKTVGGLPKLRHCGGERVDWIVTFTAAAYNLIRLRTLLARPA